MQTTLHSRTGWPQFNALIDQSGSYNLYNYGASDTSNIPLVCVLEH
eukprot:SAG11_NODE_15340_length_581_cov_1.307054_1_plen_46_part_00